MRTKNVVSDGFNEYTRQNLASSKQDEPSARTLVHSFIQDTRRAFSLQLSEIQDKAIGLESPLLPRTFLDHGPAIRPVLATKIIRCVDDLSNMPLQYPEVPQITKEDIISAIRDLFEERRALTSEAGRKQRPLSWILLRDTIGSRFFYKSGTRRGSVASQIVYEDVSDCFPKAFWDAQHTCLDPKKREAFKVVDPELVENNLELLFSRAALRKFSGSNTFIKILACLYGRYREHFAKSRYKVLYQKIKQGSKLAEACFFNDKVTGQRRQREVKVGIYYSTTGFDGDSSESDTEEPSSDIEPQKDMARCARNSSRNCKRLRDRILSKFHPSEAVSLFEASGLSQVNQHLLHELKSFARRIHSSVIPEVENEDEEITLLYLCQAIVALARCGQFLATDSNTTGIKVQDIMSLLPGHAMTAAAFHFTVSSSIALRATMTVSIVPPSLVAKCLSNSTPTDYGQLAGYFCPLDFKDEYYVPRTVIIHDINSCCALAVCEVTTAKRHHTENTGETRVSTTCAIVTIFSRSMEDKDRTIFEQTLEGLLKIVFPEPLDPTTLSIPVRSAWWTLADSPATEIVWRESLEITPACPNDASLILIHAVFGILGHVRRSTLGLLMGWESFRTDGPQPLPLTQHPVNIENARRLASSQVSEFLERETRLDCTYGRMASKGMEGKKDSEPAGLSSTDDEEAQEFVESISNSDINQHVEHDPAAFEESERYGLNGRFQKLADPRLDSPSHPRFQKPFANLPKVKYDLRETNNEACISDRINQLLTQEELDFYKYTAERDNIIGDASQRMTHIVDDNSNPQKWHPAVLRHRRRFGDKLRINASLMLSFNNYKEAAASGFSTTYWQWSIANALSSERERIVSRCTNLRNQSLDIQFVLGQDELTEELLDKLREIDVDNPTTTGDYNTCYLCIVFLPSELPGASRFKIILYFGSATSELGEASRLRTHELIMAKGHKEILPLRRLDDNSRYQHISLFHEIATLPGAIRKFCAVHRFPQIQNNSLAAMDAKILAYECENICIISMGKLSLGSRRNGNSILRKLCGDLTNYFREERLEPDFRHLFDVANRCQPMTQPLQAPFYNSRGKEIYDKLSVLWLQTCKLSLSLAEADRLLKELEGDSFDPLELSPGALYRKHTFLGDFTKLDVSNRKTFMPDFVYKRIQQIARAKIYEEAASRSPSFVQWEGERSIVKSGGLQRIQKSICWSVKSQLQRDYRHSAKSFDAVWQSELVSSVILVQYSKLAFVLSKGYVTPDAWEAWSVLPAWMPPETSLFHDNQMDARTQDEGRSGSSSSLVSTPQDVLDTLAELQARYDARAWNNQPREVEEQSLEHLAHASGSRGTNKGAFEWLQERVSIKAIKSCFAVGERAVARREAEKKPEVSDTTSAISSLSMIQRAQQQGKRSAGRKETRGAPARLEDPKTKVIKTKYSRGKNGSETPPDLKHLEKKSRQQRKAPLQENESKAICRPKKFNRSIEGGVNPLMEDRPLVVSPIRSLRQETITQYLIRLHSLLPDQCRQINSKEDLELLNILALRSDSERITLAKELVAKHNDSKFNQWRFLERYVWDQPVTKSTDDIATINALQPFAPKAIEKRKQLVSEFSKRVDLDSGLIDSNYQYLRCSEQGLIQLWKQDEDGSCLFDQLEARYQEHVHSSTAHGVLCQQCGDQFSTQSILDDHNSKYIKCIGRYEPCCWDIVATKGNGKKKTAGKNRSKSVEILDDAEPTSS
ncbi:hypothetical protein OEA41_005747 [Lepraria neglecta]|uniref:Uncharacterized protein n=1 Tax=Lepraria neglecta TaxID=209136 RepID=A0AAD9Z6R1_9LECA|nr:hypothetical protein OEA41_005747 [Lepraria neglecta]